jgi:anti-sigma regulatory factor (Ser/Thr protein kinase)
MTGNGETEAAGEGPNRRGDQLDLRQFAPALLTRIREWLAGRLAGLSRNSVANVVLAADELVTNAYEHGDGPRALCVHRSDEPCVVRLEVVDSNHRPVTVGHSRFGLAAYRGRGLVLVERLSRAWGVDTPAGRNGKIVWAEIVCD